VGDRGDYFSRKQSQEQRLEELISSRQVEATKRDELRRQLASVNPHGIVEDGSGRAVIPGNETSQRISELERARRDLLLRVTELHPDVRALEEQIAQLSVQLDAELARTIGRARQDGAASASNPVYVEIQIALSNANLKIAGLDGEIENVRNTISTLTQEVDEAPELESQFVQLSRDYDNYQSLYNEVLNQAERERIGRVGGEKDVISFNIIEPPRATFEPVSPNRPMLLTLVLLIGLGVGAALPLMLWLIKPTVHKTSDLQEMFPFPVLGSLSLDMRRARNSNFESLMLFGIASSSLILCFVSLLVLQDFIFAPSPTQG
jgi:polysaccharide chain length determinant protein (PEP-CTERM system associated)